MFFGYQAGDDSRIMDLLHYSGFRCWSETVAPAGTRGPLVQFYASKLDFLFGAPQVEVQPAVNQGGAVAQVEDAGFPGGGGDVVAHGWVWHLRAYLAVAVTFGVAGGRREVGAVGAALVR